MSATIDDVRPIEPVGGELAGPRLVSGTELLGRFEGSGLREPPCLVLRCDGQVVQLSELLFVIAGELDGRAPAQVADAAGRRLDLRITPEQIAYVIEQKLAPLGLVSGDGSRPAGLQPRVVLLGLRFRVALLSPRTVRRCAGALSPLFLAPVVVLALLALGATDGWLLGHGIGRGVHDIIRAPVLALALVALTLASLAWHELGHATACHHGGARPGRIGAGIYLVWPALYTDVTDSYRLGRTGRLRTDLGGVYFNALFALAAMGAFLATGFEPLLVLVVGQQLILVDQFAPWMRLDGYHVVSDLIGVSDLFERIRPVMASLRPGGPPQPRVAELKPWARLAVTGWVIGTVCVLAAMLGLIIVDAPAYVSDGWASIVTQTHTVGHTSDAATAALGGISIVLLCLPAAAVLFTYLTVCRGAGTRLALRREALTTSRPLPAAQSGVG